ncbi:hypothetical protein F8388_011331 [Cannabis sativa]|uniref:B-like cyclin n=1 Tax=Cannabis sativa TaxID=3483 RepID=A0A7J6FAM9_CANSA|nr:hypothetical protein F8388_011331 [Cannabis sativa]KAF4392682.1 hypothetical protein G4B88_029421 [Cannabis sativa]
MLRVPDYDPYNPIPFHGNQRNKFDYYFKLESSVTDPEDYDTRKSRYKFRCRALIVIFKYSNCKSYDPLASYLALNYFDRYLDNGNRVPNVMSCLIHNVELAVICCLTLAWKMRNITFNISEYQAEMPNLRQITEEQFMEVEFRILEGLNWDLRVITPICFVPLYTTRFLGTSHRINKRIIHDIIINSHQSNFMKKQKPSVIAASALIAASYFLYPRIYATFRCGLSTERFIQRCVGRMIKLSKKLKIFAGTDDKTKRKVQEESGSETSESEYSEILFSNDVLPTQLEQEEDTAEKFVQREGKQVATTSETRLERGADKGKGIVLQPEQEEDPPEKFEQREGKQVVATSEPSLERPADKGKGIVLQPEHEEDPPEKFEQREGKQVVTTTERSLEEEMEEMQWNFPLRWTVGELYGGLIDIFEPPSEIEPAVDDCSDQDEPLPEPSFSELLQHDRQHMAPNPFRELTRERQAFEVAAQQALLEAQKRAQKVHHGRGKCLINNCFCCLCCCDSLSSSGSSDQQPLAPSFVVGTLNHCCCCKSCNLL